MSSSWCNTYRSLPYQPQTSESELKRTESHIFHISFITHGLEVATDEQRIDFIVVLRSEVLDVQVNGIEFSSLRRQSVEIDIKQILTKK